MQEMINHNTTQQHIDRFPHQADQESGQNLIEFALILGLIIVFLFAAVQISNLLQQKSDLDNMVRQAAQQAGEFGGGQRRSRSLYPQTNGVSRIFH